jgi:hypothetical protein
MSGAKICAGLALLLAASACSGADQFSRAQSGSVPTSESGNAIVVFGLNFRAPGGAPVNGTLRLAWASYDPVNGQVLLTNRFGATRTCNDPRFDIVPDFCKRHETSYHAVEVTPGHYILSSGMVAAGNRTYITNFREMPSWTNWNRSAEVGPSRAPRFTAAAGEVIYVGDFFFFPSSFPVRLTGFEWHPDAARAHLAANRIAGTLIERRPVSE